ncbi:hypothetical protein FOQG_17859 [Fusarium oxysporum f. sp. raphani 54005]|uniref:Uncharacterized protein n=1 Tax=Fusarium oxysporum f. sp. raphani 54005 TaxID=1089458 RepID=X0BG12_FUSOX|nr:hypothetical protein FOQG_17859 [Fusarium oxysporum f. sp. raphani 54005]
MIDISSGLAIPLSLEPLGTRFQEKAQKENRPYVTASGGTKIA